MTTLSDEFALAAPIMQAPMAGASDAQFVLAACHVGVLGSLGAGMMSPAQIDAQITAIKAGHHGAFNVNLMIVDEKDSDTFACAMPSWLVEYYAELGVTPILDQAPAYRFAEQFEVLLANPVPVASFTFGLLSAAQVEALHAVGSFVIGTANTTAEVLAWQGVGADAVVVQGAGAGGHQGGWLGGELVSTTELLEHARAQTDIALIAAGGVSGGQDVAELLALGADLVAVGTLFLTTTESVVHPLWQCRLLTAHADDTAFVRVFSGKTARGIQNAYTTRFAEQTDIPPYPTLNAMTKSLRAFGAKSQNPDLMSLWAGTGVAGARQESMAELVARLVSG